MREWIARLPKALVVTGTDTDVGKTVVSSLLTLALMGLYWKPIQTGCSDREEAKRLTGLPEKHFAKSVYSFTEPVSPHLAARIAGSKIELDAIVLPDWSSHPALIVEGAGGVLVPVNEKALMIDLFLQLGLPLLIVARTQLGTINHTLLTLEVLRRRNLTVIGIVLNGPRNQKTKEAIEQYGQVEVLAELEKIDPLSWQTLSGLL